MSIRVLLVSLALIWTLAACGPSPAPDSPPDADSVAAQSVAASPIPPTSAPDDAIIATVNGQPIYEADYQQALVRRQSETDAADPEALAAFVLTTLINQALVSQEAERVGIAISADDVAAEYEALRGMAESEAAWGAWLAENGYTEETLREELRVQLTTAAVRDYVLGEADIANAPMAHARHILVDSEAQALELREQLLNGAAFVELAATHSLDVTTREQGGDLGWFTQEELLEPTVAQAAFDQEAGDISEPVATRLGYHIVETLAFDTQPLPPEKQAQVAQVIFDEWLTTLTDSAIIERNP